MLTIPLQAIPAQSVPFSADGQQYNIRVWFDGDDLMLMDVTMNGSVVITSQPCLVGQQIIPFNYLEGAGGNFIFTTASGNNPAYANFGTSDILLYATNAELAQQRAANVAAALAINLLPGQAA